MGKTLEFIFDFASPNAYLVWDLLPPLVDRTGAHLLVTPCLLGGIFRATNNQAPMVRFSETPARLNYEMLEMRRFIAAHGLGRFTMNPHFPVNTLLVMRGAIVAQQDGRFDAFARAVLAAMWEDGRPMADPETVAAVLDAAGFDGKALLERTQDQAVKDRLVANTEAAVARGVFGIPSFIVDGELYFGKERLAQVEAALLG